MSNPIELNQVLELAEAIDQTTWGKSLAVVLELVQWQKQRIEELESDLYDTPFEVVGEQMNLVD